MFLATRFGFALLLCLRLCFKHQVVKARNVRNVFLIMADQHRHDVLSAVNSGAYTPNLDSLINDGVLYVNGFSSTPTCTPARSALLTGRSPWYHGMLGYGSIAQHYDMELPRTMLANGF